MRATKNSTLSATRARKYILAIVVSIVVAGSIVYAQNHVVSGVRTAAGQPSGTASGDLSGTYPAPSVVGLNGAAIQVAPSSAIVRNAANDGWSAVVQPAFGSTGALATSGSTQATAAAITKRYTQLTETNGTRLGARLPAATGSGALYMIDSFSLTDFWVLYPASGEQINKYGADGTSRASNSQLLQCTDYSTANWTCVISINTPNGANGANMTGTGTGFNIGGATTFNGNIGQNAAFASSAQFVGLSTTTLTASSGATFQGNIISGTDATSNTTLATGATIRGATLVTGGTANQAGANLAISTGSGKGSGTPPVISFSAPPIGASGNGLTSAVNVMTLGYNATSGVLSTVCNSEIDVQGPSTGTNAGYGVINFNGVNGNQLNFASVGGQNQLSMANNNSNPFLFRDFNGNNYVIFDTRNNQQQTRIIGSVSSVAAAAGDVGEYKSSFVTAPSGVSLSSTSAKTVTSIALTAGDWDVTAIGGLDGNLTGANFQASISTTNNTLGTQLGYDTVQVPLDSTSSADVTLSIPGVQALIANGATTTYYLVVKATFTGTALGYGSIVARRRR